VWVSVLQLVEQFLSENIKVEGQGAEVIHSQLYIGTYGQMKVTV